MSRALPVLILLGLLSCAAAGGDAAAAAGAPAAATSPADGATGAEAAAVTGDTATATGASAADDMTTADDTTTAPSQQSEPAVATSPPDETASAPQASPAPQQEAPAPQNDPDPVTEPASGSANGAAQTAQAALAAQSTPAEAQPGAQQDAALAPAALPAEGPLRVAADGSGDVTTIAAALLAPGHDREIRIAPGIYTEALVLDHKLRLVADGGPVTIDGGPAPAITLDAVTQVVLRGLTLTSSVTAASVTRGQLVLEQCALQARPGGTALRTAAHGAQLVLRSCRVDAGAGTALQLHVGSSGEFIDSAFAWDDRNENPLLVAGSPTSFVVQGSTFGWRRYTPRTLLSDVVAVPMPLDGRAPVIVQPERAQWPAWAVPNLTHAATIGDALARAAPGLRIDIAPGTYNESVGLRQAAHLRALGGPGSVVVRQEGVPCLWANVSAGVVCTVTGLVFEGAVAERTATVQVNGGQLELIDCRVVNTAGHGVVVTSSWDACLAVLRRSEIDCAGRGLFISGETSRARLEHSRLVSRSVALFALEGAQVSMEGGVLQADDVGVELWGQTARVDLGRCTLGATPRMVQLVKGAARSQLSTEEVLFGEPEGEEGADHVGGAGDDSSG